MEQMQDLFTALNMFKQSADELSAQRAISGANDQVQQLRASEASDQQKRMGLQQLSNQLVGQLAGLGTPASTIEAVAGAFGPKQYANANQMNADAVLTGNSSLGAEAQKQQAFEQNPEYKKQLIAAKANAGMNGLAMMKFQNEQQEFNWKQLHQYRDDLDMTKASSRTQFGQWAQVDSKGERLQQLLGDPKQWNQITGPQLTLVKEGLGSMAKGGILTKEESEQMGGAAAKLSLAEKEAYATGKPVAVDMSGWASLYSTLATREGELSKSKMLDAVYNKIQGSAQLGLKNGVSDQFKLTTANALNQLGLNVNPDTISVDPKKGVVIPELQASMDAAAKAPKAVNDAFAAAKSGDAGAMQFMQAYGISPTMSKSDAIRIVQRKIKAGIFQ